MSKYATISVPVEIKEELEKAKGEKEWGDFLAEMFIESQNLKRKKALEELRELLSEEDLENIRKSSKEFRESFKFR
ncbi:MAG: antitoxin VapB family protein [Candidatus Bathyarchaeia archaeon]|jgi:predicted CopG family antitoxin